METRAKVTVRGTAGCELLRHVESVDPRAAEGLRRETPTLSSSEMDALVEEENRRSITDAYQRLLFEVKVLHRKGNFKSSQGEVIVQRVREIASGGKTTLDLSGFTIFDDFADLLVPYLRSKSCKLVALNLARTPLGIQAAATVAQATNGVLQTLQFSDQPIPIGIVRSKVKSRGEAVLSGHNFNHLDAAAIGVLVERERNKLQALDLSRNCLTGPKGHVFRGLGILFQGLKSCLQLKELNLGAANLRSDGLVELANAIQDFPALEKLDLSRNRLAHNSADEKRVSGVEAFFNALWQARKLRELNLAGNHLDYLSSVCIAKMLAVNTTLEILTLAQNSLADAGVVQLSEGLKKNAALVSLDLSECHFGCEGMNEVAVVLRKFNSTLQTLDVRNNTELRSQGYRSLAKCLSVNHSVTEVHLSAEPRHEKYADKIRGLLAVNMLLKAVRMDADRFAAFPALSEPQRTNFIEKLQRFSECDLRRFHENRLVEKAAVLSDGNTAAGLSTLRHYATLEQYAPLKRMLWLFEAGSRHDHLEQRAEQSSKKKAGKGTSAQVDNDEEDDDDIWDYPLF